MIVQPTYQKLIQSEGMVEHLVRGLKTENTELQKHCASAIFKVILQYIDNRCMEKIMHGVSLSESRLILKKFL